MKSRDVLIDACVLINLCASGVLEEISRAVHVRFVVTAEVAAEALYIEVQGERERIDIDRLIEIGALRLDELKEEEIAAMVEFANDVDEGEAATLAVATNRGIAVATDDIAALRFIDRRELQVTVLGTSDLVRQWAESPGSPRREDVRGAIVRIELGASFHPSQRDPNYSWWKESSSPIE